MSQYEKIVAAVIIFALSYISGLIPCVTVKYLVTKIGKSARFLRIIGILNCFAGGVFFSTCVLEILPEAREKMEEAKVHWGWTTEYPLSELLLGIGFFVTLTLEYGAHTCLHGRSKDKTTDFEADDQSSAQPAANFSYENKNYKEDDQIKGNHIAIRSFEDSSCLDDVSYKTCNATDTSLNKADSISPNAQNKDVKLTFENSDEINNKQDQQIPQTENVTTSSALQALSAKSEEPGSSNIRGLVFLMAISLHMIFEGLSLGLLQKASDIWTLLFALCLHKALVFFTIGLQTLELVKSVRKTIIYMCLFSLVTPIGIIIGLSISSEGAESTQDSLAAIFQSISAGVFLYVTFFEIFQRELEAGTHDLVKVFVSILGFALVGGTKLLDHD